MKVFLFTVLIIAIVVFLLAVRIIFCKDGKFPNMHIDGSKAMKERDIHCVMKEDRLMRRRVKRIRE